MRRKDISFSKTGLLQTPNRTDADLAMPYLVHKPSNLGAQRVERSSRWPPRSLQPANHKRNPVLTEELHDMIFRVCVYSVWFCF